MRQKDERRGMPKELRYRLFALATQVITALQ
jgi:hypothetical protein